MTSEGAAKRQTATVAKDADLNPFWGTGADALSAKARGVEWNAAFEVALGFMVFRVFWVCLLL
jgi:hypothetical protein